MLEEHQTQSWSLADWAEQGRGLMYLGQLPCEIIMNSKELVDYKIFVLHCTWHFVHAHPCFLQHDQGACTYINMKRFSENSLLQRAAETFQQARENGNMTAVENDARFTRSADLMGRYRCHLTSNAFQGCTGSFGSKSELSNSKFEHLAYWSLWHRADSGLIWR